MMLFPREEYLDRLQRTKQAMSARDVDVLITADPASMHYLTGYDGWSFYVPQVAIVCLDEAEPYWIGRAMDAAGGLLTAWMSDGHVIGYPENMVQTPERHPMEFVASFIRERGWHARAIGVDLEANYLTPKGYERLRAGLVEARLVDASLLVNWVRVVKSEREIACMRRAAGMVARVMQVACDAIEPGVRQCDVAAKIYAAQVGGDPEVAGDVTGLCPYILTGENSAAPHLMWSERRFRRDETTVFELGAAYRHYTAALARTVHLGTVPERVRTTALAVEEGMNAVLETVRPGITAGEVEATWRAVIARHGLKKESRIGYSIGLGYPPDWGEQTISLRAGEKAVLQANNTLHVILGMWMDGWGLELSETLLVNARGSECLTSFPRAVYVK